jgi:hypothetical protein
MKLSCDLNKMTSKLCGDCYDFLENIKVFIKNAKEEEKNVGDPKPSTQEEEQNENSSSSNRSQSSDHTNSQSGSAENENQTNIRKVEIVIQGEAFEMIGESFFDNLKIDEEINIDILINDDNTDRLIVLFGEYGKILN